MYLYDIITSYEQFQERELGHSFYFEHFHPNTKGQSSQACLPIGVSVLNREIKYEISLWNDATSHLGVLKIMFLVHFHGNRLVTITFLYFDSYRLRVPLLTPPLHVPSPL